MQMNIYLKKLDGNTSNYNTEVFILGDGIMGNFYFLYSSFSKSSIKYVMFL